MTAPPDDRGPVLVGSENAIIGLAEGRRILEDGGSALDAAEAVVRLVEDAEHDHTVGYGGYPNICGDVELDAAIMEGATRRAGAVGGLQGVRNPISVARAVMERLPHVLLVGEGAARFAGECGFERRDMLSDHAAAIWRRGLELVGGPPKPDAALAEDVRTMVLDPEHVTGTVNVIARDASGRLATAVSTSGWAWKYPGRVGDTGLIGAGSYCDDRWGAATCTGWGELAIRGSVARTVVLALRAGASPSEAIDEVLHDLPDAFMGDEETPLHVVAMAADGRCAAASTAAQRKYARWERALPEPETRARRQVVVTEPPQTKGMADG